MDLVLKASSFWANSKHPTNNRQPSPVPFLHPCLQEEKKKTTGKSYCGCLHLPCCLCTYRNCSVKDVMSCTLPHSKSCIVMLKLMAERLTQYSQYSSICKFSICLVYRYFWRASFKEVLSLLQIQKKDLLQRNFLF